LQYLLRNATKTKNLPFDNQNKAVAVMKIKAIGKVVNNFVGAMSEEDFSEKLKKLL
jgi:hypothetical protein